MAESSRSAVLIWVVAALATLLVAVQAGVWWAQSQFDAAPVILQSAPPAVFADPRPTQRSDNENDEHRHYPDVRSIEDTLQIPSEFDQTEALYALAGRSDTRQVELLINQALGIEDLSDRQAALQILFLRLVDLNPPRAVALAAQTPFTEYHSIEDSIWRGWSRKQFAEALAAAAKLSPESRKNHAAQVMYMAFGVIGSEQSLWIEEATGIKPNRRAKAHYAISLAEDSPTAAVAFMNGLRPTGDQQAVARQLARHLSKQMALGVLDLAEGIEALTTRRIFKRVAIDEIAAVDPRLILDRWQNSRAARRSDEPINAAFYGLVQQDMDDAVEFWEQLENPTIKLDLAKIIIAEMGSQDMQAALEWAMTVEASGLKQTVLSAVSELAGVDANAVYDVILSLPDSDQKRLYQALTIGKMAEGDPRLAVARISELPTLEGRKLANSYLLSAWVDYETVAAFEYALANSAELEPRVLSQFSNAIPYVEPELVLNNISKVEEWVARQWVNVLVDELLENSTLDETLALLDDYQQLDVYPILRESVVRRLRVDDFERAVALTMGMPGSESRDRSLVMLIDDLQETDPARAAELYREIENDISRSQVSGLLATGWYQRDPDRARNWINELPSGERDEAVLWLSMSIETVTESDYQLLDVLENQQVRDRAQTMMLLKIADTNPERAQELARQAGLDWNELSEQAAQRNRLN